MFPVRDSYPKNLRNSNSSKAEKLVNKLKHDQVWAVFDLAVNTQVGMPASHYRVSRFVP